MIRPAGGQPPIGRMEIGRHQGVFGGFIGKVWKPLKRSSKVDYLYVFSSNRLEMTAN
jgi:hypothetical protein